MGDVGIDVRLCKKAALVTSRAHGGQMFLVNLDSREIWRRFTTLGVPTCIAAIPATRWSHPCVFVATHDGFLRKFNLLSSLPRVTAKHPKAATSIAVGLQTLHLFTGCKDGYVRKFSSRSGMFKQKFEPRVHEEGVISLVLSPCERYLYLSGADAIVRKYDVMVGSCICTYGDPVSGLHQILLSFCGFFMYAISDCVRVFHSETCELVSADFFTNNREETISGCELCHEGGFLILAVGPHLLKYDIEDGTLINALLVADARIRRTQLSPDGAFVLVTAADGRLRIVDVVTGDKTTILEEDLDLCVWTL